MRTWFPLLAVLGLLASGCSSGSADQPTALPTLTATPIATASPVPIPPQATANTSQSLDAFVRFYFQQLNVAFSTSDSSIIRRYSDPICETCNNYAAALEGEPGRTMRGDSFASIEVAAPPIDPNGTIVEVSGIVPAREVFDEHGRLVKKLKSDGRFGFQVNVVRVGAGWRVRGIRLTK